MCTATLPTRWGLTIGGTELVVYSFVCLGRNRTQAVAHAVAVLLFGAPWDVFLRGGNPIISLL